MKTKKIILFAGTGFIGQSLAKQFQSNGWKVIVIGRSLAIHKFREKQPSTPSDNSVETAIWDGKTLHSDWTQHLEEASLVINLAGKSVNCRYTEKNKIEVLESRLVTTSLIGEAIAKCQIPPEVWMNAGSSTIYKHSLEKANEEDTGLISEWKNDNMPFSVIDRIRFKIRGLVQQIKHGKESPEFNNLKKDFSVSVCQAWEKSFWDCSTPKTRKLCLRIAITLGKGGVMIPYRMLAKLGLGGYQGTGRQKISWIHISDIGRAIAFLYHQKNLEGVFNLASPEIATNRSFTKAVRKAMNKKIGWNAPNELLEIGALFMGTETELILKSRWVYPKRLLEAGFHFQYANLESTVQDILQNWESE